MFFFALLFGRPMDCQLFLLHQNQGALRGDRRHRQAEFNEKFIDGAHIPDTMRLGDLGQGWAVARSGAVRDGIADAAIIVVVVFTAFGVTGPIPSIELGVTMAAAVILDATVVRMLTVPAALVLLGNRTWWIPRWPVRVLPSFTFRH